MAFVDDYPGEAKVVRACIAVAATALGIGALFGVIQALHRTGYLRIIPSSQYYTVLTGHGVLLALIFTIFFLCAIFTWGVTASLGRPLPNPRFTWAWFWTMLVGTVMAAAAILGGFVQEVPMEADVMYTFYAPLQAHPVFYIGLALFVIGTWLAGLDWFRAWWRWRADNPGERMPLRTFMVLTTMIMWYLSSAGVAVEVVVFMIPWSLGLVPEVNPLLTRSLFWYFGHAVVYFWLLPAYLIWYAIVPKLADGRLFSDSLTRVVFIAFLLLSTPVGFHHQYLDPGVTEGYKFLAMTNTMFLLFPSLLTAFTVVASIEYGARQRGGTGYVSWLRNLPWDEPAFAGCALAGVMFAAGGFSGMINAGMNINYLVHNTAWVPGHFHLTVGTAVALTLMAGTYWLFPRISGKEIKHETLALIQPYLWFLGVTLFSNALHREGLAGVPRRTAAPTYRNVEYTGAIGGFGEMQLQVAIGGTLMFLSVTLYLFVLLRSWMGERVELETEAIPEPLSGPEDGPAVLDNLALWTGLAVLLVLIAYVVPLADIASDGLFQAGTLLLP